MSVFHCGSVVSVFECFGVSVFQCLSVSVVQCPVFQCFRVSVFQWVSVSVFQCFSVSGFVATVLVVLNKGNDVTVDQSMLAACTNMHLYSRVFLFSTSADFSYLSQIDPGSMPNRSQIDAKSIGPRSMPHRSQIDAKSIPDRCQMDSRSMPNRFQIDAKSIPDRCQIVPR